MTLSEQSRKKKIQLALVDGNNRFGLLEDAHLDTMISISAFSELDSQEKIALSCANSGKLDVSAKLNSWKDIVWKLSGYVSRMSDPANTIEDVICEDLESLMKNRLKSEYGNHAQMLKALIFAFEHPQSFLEGLKYIATCEATESYSVPISQFRFWDDVNPFCFSMAFKAATSMIIVGKPVNVSVLQKLYRLGMATNNNYVAMFVKLFFKTQEEKLPDFIFRNDHDTIKLLDNTPARLVRKLTKLLLIGLTKSKAKEIGLQPLKMLQKLESLEDSIDQGKAMKFFIRYEFLLETPIDYDAFNEAAHVAVKEIWTKINKFFEDKKTISQETSNSDSGSEAKDANSVNQSQDTRDEGAAAATTEKKRPRDRTTSTRQRKRRRKHNQSPSEPGVEHVVPNSQQKVDREQRAAKRTQLQEAAASGKALEEAGAALSATLTLSDEAAYDSFDDVLPGCAVEGDNLKSFDDKCASAEVKKTAKNAQTVVASGKALVKAAAASSATLTLYDEATYNSFDDVLLGCASSASEEEAAASSASEEEVEPNAQSGYGPVEAKAAASATEEGKIPVKNAQTGKALVGAAAAASESVNSSAAGVDDNEVFGNSL